MWFYGNYMKKKALILFERKISDSLKKYFDVIESDTISVSYATLSESVFVLQPEGSKIYFPQITDDIADFDAIYIRKIRQYSDAVSAILSLYPNLNYVQTPKALNYGSKVIQYALFARENLPFPKTVYVNSQNLGYIVEQVEKHLSYPLVYKDPKSFGGLSCYLAHSHDELLNGLKSIQDEGITFIFQEYIPNDYDIRVLVIDYKADFAFKRVRNSELGEWRNNLARGATQIDLDLDRLDEKVKDLAEKATKSVGLRICGADIAISSDNNKLYLFEVNFYPSFLPGQGEPIVRLVEKVLKG